jgi:D-aminoacyl-tRNA deacylase
MHSIFLKEFPFADLKKVFDSNKVFGLKTNQNNFTLYLLNELHIFSEKASEINADLIVFASRHSGKKPCLTAHPVGNYGKAEFGGKEKTLVKTNSNVIKSYLQHLNELQKSKPELKDYSVALETTHHGPFLETPALFIEVGCEEKNWNDLNACRAVCETIINASKEKGNEVAIGFGDLHYPHYFTKIVLETGIALSHMCPKHSVDLIDENLFEQMLSSDENKIDFALIEWKSLSKTQREKMISFCEKKRLAWKKVKEVL